MSSGELRRRGGRVADEDRERFAESALIESLPQNDCCKYCLLIISSGFEYFIESITTAARLTNGTDVIHTTGNSAHAEYIFDPTTGDVIL